MTKKADAPRLRAYWGRKAGFDVVTIPRSDVDLNSLEIGQAVSIEVSKTPLSRVAAKSRILAVYVRRDDSVTGRLALLREDLKDAPDVVNEDMYSFTFDLLSHPDLPLLVESASTCCNDNMRRFASENAFIVKLSDGDGFRHRWPFVPTPEQAFTSTGDK